MSVCRCGYEYLKVDEWPLILCCSYDPIILNIVSKVAFEHKIRVWHSTQETETLNGKGVMNGNGVRLRSKI